jgi:Ca-activated chloride channel family protein
VRFSQGAAAALAIGAVAALLAQGPAAQTPFRGGVRTVAVYATVQDRSGRLVPNLTKDAFQLLDNGKPADIQFFSNDIQPITAVVLLDMSGSMYPRFLRLRTSMFAFIDALLPADRIRIGTFGIEIALSPHLTGDKSELARIVREEVWPRGGTPLWSAIRKGMASIAGEAGRRVILVITDGHNASANRPGWPKGNYYELSDQAAADDFMIYAIGLPVLDEAMTDLAKLTGGGFASVDASANLTTALARVAEELRHQYVLGFTPSVLDGKTHKLQVRMHDREWSARARTSYRAEAAQ